MQKQCLALLRLAIIGLGLLVSLGSQASVVHYDALGEQGIFAPNFAHQPLTGDNSVSLNNSRSLVDFLISPALLVSNGTSLTVAAGQGNVTLPLDEHRDTSDGHHGYAVREQSTAPISSAFILVLLGFVVWFLARAKCLNTK